MIDYDLWLNSNNPADEYSYDEYIDDHHDGICPECDKTTSEADHYHCGENMKAEAKAQAAIDRYEDERY